MLLFFLIPFIIVLRIAFSETRNALPPYAPLYEPCRGEMKGWLLNVQLYLESFGALFTKSIYWTAYLNSLRIAVISTLICLLVGYPIAYAIARARSTTRMILLMMVILPFWTSFLLRVYAWIGLLKNNGVINNFLMWTGIIDQPIVMLQTDFAIYVGIVYSYLPFMILPLYSNLEKMDLTLLEAAADLGSRPFNAFMKITLPLSMPGIVAGSMLVFIPVVGEFVFGLLGPADTLMIGKLLWREFFTARNWPGAARVAIALVLLLVIPIVFLQRAQSAEARRQAMMQGISTFRLSALVFGFAFLYVPILSLIIYSFNKSRLVTVWGGFSTQWYGRLLDNHQILSAAWLSLKIAALNATGAVILGTLSGLALARFGKFRGRTLLAGMNTAPLVMPEVITGLSLLLLFVVMEQLFRWPAGRGMTTVTIAHITLTMAYVTVIVQSRLSTLDDSLEEAAMDLGARPAKVFFVITLPIIAPALVSGWLLSFTISLDDLVITSFVSGPGSSTLPMVIFSKVRLGVSPDINALASIMVLLVTVGVIIAGILMARQERIRQRDMQMAAAGGVAR